MSVFTYDFVQGKEGKVFAAAFCNPLGMRAAGFRAYYRSCYVYLP
jgi:hypothetical protein